MTASSAHRLGNSSSSAARVLQLQPACAGSEEMTGLLVFIGTIIRLSVASCLVEVIALAK
jgi:hypothetical protein